MRTSKPLIHCSELPRLELCPGSHLAAQTCPEPPSNEDAEFGNAVHTVLSWRWRSQPVGTDLMDLLAKTALPQAQRANAAWILELFSEWIEQHVFDPNAVTDSIEPEFGLFLDTETYTLDGCPDLIIVQHADTEYRWNVVEYKAGWKRQETSDLHLQGRAYLVLVAQHFAQQKHLPAPQSIRLHIMAAGNERDDRYSVSTYERSAIDRCRQEIEAIIGNACAKGAKRVPGAKQCRYCPAFAREECPETRQMPAKLAERMLAMKDARAMFRSIAPAQRAEVLQRIQVMRRALDISNLIQDEAKALLEKDPASIPGWTLKRGGNRRTIPVAAQAFVIAKAQWGVTNAEFSEIVSVSFANVVNLVHRVLGFRAAQESGAATKKGPSLKHVGEIVESALKGILETKPIAPSLVETEVDQQP